VRHDAPWEFGAGSLAANGRAVNGEVAWLGRDYIYGPNEELPWLED